MPKKKNKIADMTERQLMSKSRKEMIEGMTEREIAFCEYYINDYNMKMAAIKAGYNFMSNRQIGRIVRNKQSVINYIAWLKLKLYHKASVKAEDIFNSYAKMAFYDVTDYYFVDDEGKVKLNPLNKIDGQIIQEITTTKDGSVTVKFPDRLRSFQKLEDYMDTNPYDWKRRLEEKKIEILEEKLTLDKSKSGLFDEIEDDGFLSALEAAASKINVLQLEESGETDDED